MQWDSSNPSAEQHALDNPGHTVAVKVVETDDGPVLMLTCASCDWWGCDWWDEQ